MKEAFPDKTSVGKVSIPLSLALAPPQNCWTFPFHMVAFKPQNHENNVILKTTLFGQRTRKGRCPIEHSGEFPSVRPNEQTNEQANVRPVSPGPQAPGSQGPAPMPPP